MKVKFLGAAGNVTGSRFVLETEKTRLLIDCGLFQERKLLERNWSRFPEDPAGIDLVLLTHAHIDHSGYLPKLVREGFKGKIFCTGPTADVTRIALLDSARLQEADAEFKRKRHKKEKRKAPFPEIPLYRVEEAEQVFPLFERIEYGKKIKVSSDIEAVFYPAGHILGAAMIELTVSEEARKKICVFSGDIGRRNRPLLEDPTPFHKADYVFMESTYGNRVHEAQEVSLDKFQRVINETYQRGGNIVIPTFAIERAQEVLFYLGELLRRNRIPHLVTFLDSPMAIEVTEVFKKYASGPDRSGQALADLGPNPFDFPLLKPTRGTEDSKAINHIKGTSIIMSGSGMCTGGRIKHHLLNNISREESTILFVGYQARGTLGRTILERPAQVRILGQTLTVNAAIEKINGFSAHADKNELLEWIGAVKQGPEKIFVIHGENEAAEDLAASLRAGTRAEVIVPEFLQEAVL